MAVGEILLLERDPVLRELIEELCADDGLNVTACRTLPALDSAITGVHGQVVLMDAQSVERAAADDLRRYMNKLGTLAPVVLLASSERTCSALDGRCIRVLPMPFDIYELMSAIRSAIDGDSVTAETD
jgi:DNA-binding NtrC family response regulator